MLPHVGHCLNTSHPVSPGQETREVEGSLFTGSREEFGFGEEAELPDRENSLTHSRTQSTSVYSLWLKWYPGIWNMCLQFSISRVSH